MEKLIAAQRDLHERIARTFENLKKSGTAMLTPELHFVRTGDPLDEVWGAAREVVRRVLRRAQKAWVFYLRLHERDGDRVRLAASEASGIWASVEEADKWGARSDQVGLFSSAQCIATYSAPLNLGEVRGMTSVPWPLLLNCEEQCC